jgi:hypothetical protein
MSKTVATFIGVVLTVSGLHAFRAMQKSNITGTIISPDAPVWVYAINGRDSLKTRVTNGKFQFTVKPGSWKVLIENSKLFNDEAKKVDVEEGRTMDLGTIRLN